MARNAKFNLFRVEIAAAKTMNMHLYQIFSSIFAVEDIQNDSGKFKICISENGLSVKISSLQNHDTPNTSYDS